MCGSHRALAAALALVVASELALPGAEARRKRRRQRSETEQLAPKEPPSQGCPPPGCEPGLHLVIEVEEGDQPPRGVPSFRYRVRIGEQRVEGGCPPSREDPPSAARCVAGGVVFPFSPPQADVVIEAAGFRPLLQTLMPIYEDRCCPRAKLRLVLRRETG
ncbi:MAG: hypothetical protein RMK29_01270 [Myxococcales bacterium]|nr:hypothetical protein [Myxococcales bacterium]